MQVSLSAPGRDALSFTIETHKPNDVKWRGNSGADDVHLPPVPGPSNINQNSNFPYNQTSTNFLQQNKEMTNPSNTTTCPDVAGAPPKIYGPQPNAANFYQRPSAIASCSSAQPPRQHDSRDLFEEYMSSCQSVISSRRNMGGGGEATWENLPAKRIKTEPPASPTTTTTPTNLPHRTIITKADSGMCQQGFNSRVITPAEHKPPTSNPSQPLTNTSQPPTSQPQPPTQQQQTPVNPTSIFDSQSFYDDLLSCGLGKPGFEATPQDQPSEQNKQNTPFSCQQQSQQQNQQQNQQQSQQQSPQHQEVQEQEQTSPNQGIPSSEESPESEQGWKLGDIPENNALSNFQETIFLEQLAAIDENLKTQVPMDEEHCRSFLRCAMSGAKLRQYTILHAYQILIKRIVRLSNSIQDFIELAPGDMHRLLVANTVSMINIRIARWFHPQTTLEQQLSFCSDSGQLYQQVLLQKQLDPQFEIEAIDMEDVFVSPWCCDSSYEDRYFFLLKKMHQLPLDSTPLILLSVIMLFNSEAAVELTQHRLIINNERKFSLLLYRYLNNKYSQDVAQNYFQKFVQAKSSLVEMADILINKRLIC
jgi:hypothetical protein